MAPYMIMTENFERLNPAQIPCLESAFLCFHPASNFVFSFLSLKITHFYWADFLTHSPSLSLYKLIQISRSLWKRLLSCSSKSDISSKSNFNFLGPYDQRGSFLPRKYTFCAFEHWSVPSTFLFHFFWAKYFVYHVKMAKEVFTTARPNAPQGLKLRDMDEKRMHNLFLKNMSGLIEETKKPAHSSNPWVPVLFAPCPSMTSCLWISQFRLKFWVYRLEVVLKWRHVLRGEGV